MLIFFDQIPSFLHSLLCMIVDANFASPISLGFMASLALSIRIMFMQRGGRSPRAALLPTTHTSAGFLPLHLAILKGLILKDISGPATWTHAVGFRGRDVYFGFGKLLLGLGLLFQLCRS